MLRRVFREPALWMGAFSLVAAAGGFLREQAVAYKLGVSIEADALFTALSLVNFLPSIIVGALAVSIAPHFSRAAGSGGERAGEEAVGQLLSVAVIAAAVAAGVMVLALWCVFPFVPAARNHDKLRLTFELATVFSASIPLSAYIGGAIAALNAFNRFGLATATNVVPPLVATALVYALPQGPWSVMVALLVGLAAQAVALLVPLHHRGIRYGIAALTWRARLKHLSGMLHVALQGAASALSALVIQASVAASGAHGMSTFNYATKIPSSVLAILSNVFPALVLPILAAQAAGLPHSKKRLKLYAGGGMVVALLGAAAIAFGSPVLIKLFLARGKFRADDVITVAHLQFFAAIQIPFGLLATLASRFLNARHDNRYLNRLSWLNLALTLGVAVYVHRIYGAPGLLLGVAGCNAVVTALIFHRYLKITRGN
ncbi:hypothetical protein F6X40_11110 [Paraburkholderia sp. UCT31]|uniref:lipid II flippase MurJ n=1 Tax=Paraburkholderia sp. UCT31 TaxID=2615209 RepID=UPI0016567257|nr:lipid II flippase MurJ [Paraburkholderia sp. UCT31]MBC8737352.1 hypothetical protein [Paraburkholderia sp. UCT31]